MGLTLRAVVATMQWGGGGALLGLWWVDLPHVESDGWRCDGLD